MEFYWSFLPVVIVWSLWSGVCYWLGKVSERRIARGRRQDLIEHLENLARLKGQGTLNEEEFESQKRRCLAEGDPEKAVEAGRPIASIEHVNRLMSLRDYGTLTEEEFQAEKARFLRFGAQGPTAEEVAGLEYIEKLAELESYGAITSEEYKDQKRAVLSLGLAADRARVEELDRLRADGSLTEAEYRGRLLHLAEIGGRAGTGPRPISALEYVAMLADLQNSYVLSDEEVQAEKARFLRLGAQGPTAEEVAGIEHIRKLSELHDNGAITQEEFDDQKLAILAGDRAVLAKPATAWDDLGEP